MSDAAEAARKAQYVAQRRSRRDARTAEQRAADQAADTAARSAARAAAAGEHAATEQHLRDLTNRHVFESPSKIDAQNRLRQSQPAGAEISQLWVPEKMPKKRESRLVVSPPVLAVPSSFHGHTTRHCLGYCQ